MQRPGSGPRWNVDMGEIERQLNKEGRAGTSPAVCFDPSTGLIPASARKRNGLIGESGCEMPFAGAELFGERWGAPGGKTDCCGTLRYLRGMYCTVSPRGSVD
jgi:hypothetical protein